MSEETKKLSEFDLVPADMSSEAYTVIGLYEHSSGAFLNRRFPVTSLISPFFLNGVIRNTALPVNLRLDGAGRLTAASLPTNVAYLSGGKLPSGYFPTQDPWNIVQSGSINPSYLPSPTVATTSIQGVVRLATNVEANNSSVNNAVVTPQGLDYVLNTRDLTGGGGGFAPEETTETLTVSANSVTINLSAGTNFIIPLGQDVTTITLQNIQEHRRHLWFFRNTSTTNDYAVHLHTLGLKGGPEEGILLLAEEILVVSLFALDSSTLVILGWNVI